jgi:ribonuclease Y
MTPLLLNIISAVVALFIGGGAGVGLQKQLASKKTKESSQKQKEELLKAKEEALKIREEAENEVEKRRKEIDDLEKSIRNREQGLEKRFDDLDNQRKELIKTEDSLKVEKEEINKAHSAHIAALEKIAKLKKEEAKDQLIEEVKKEYKNDILKEIKKQKDDLKEDAEKEAKKIISTALGRIAQEHTAESTSYSVHLPSEDLKGRIIGKEGRNIQHFEKVTGVDVIIDEAPDSVTISSFDSVRRYVGKIAMEKLISDGRIQPSRIEEVVAKVQEDVNKEAKESAEEAAFNLGLPGFHPDLLKIVGRLKFRTSYGQNQLAHAVEVATIGGMLAAEIGADQNITKKAGFLHDVGKAVDHEVPGAHHHISMDIARKYGMSETVINAIGAHHGDIEPKTVEAILVKVADSISGSRPGARRESYENYVKRIKELENVANGFAGVDKSFAIQAGREVRIIVRPQEIDDLEAIKLAKDVARKIENDLQYPGTIKVNVIRETRAQELAK